MELGTIVKRCQQGDREAFGQLYTACHDRLMAICLHYVPDDYVAADLLHDAFLLIISKIHTLKDLSKADVWMQTVVRNVALFYLRREKQHETFSLDDVRASVGTASVQVTPLDYEEIMRQVDALPEGYRQVFRLSVLEGLSHQEIADLLHIEPHTSSSQLFRAKCLLRQTLRVLLGLLLLVGIGYLVHEKWERKNEEWVPHHDDLVVSNDDSPADSGDVVAEQVQSYLFSHRGAETPGLGRDTSGVCEAVASEDTLHLCASVREEKEADVRLEMRQEESDVKNVESEMTLPHVSLGSRQPSLTLAFFCSGMPTYGGIASLPDGQSGMNGVIDSVAHHSMPITLGIDASCQLSSTLSLRLGLRYSALSSTFRLGNTGLYVERGQQLRYLGLSLGIGYQMVHSRNGRWSCYGIASIQHEWPLRSTGQTIFIYDGVVTDTENKRLQPGRQWSVGAGLGLQYNIVPVVGLFVEPSMQYYFDTNDGLETWRTAHRTAFSVPLGIRFNF